MNQIMKLVANSVVRAAEIAGVRLVANPAPHPHSLFKLLVKLHILEPAEPTKKKAAG
jgi:hypothetical protein